MRAPFRTVSPPLRTSHQLAASAALLSLLFASSGCWFAPSGPPPPETRREPVIDVLHGESIVDDYRWLEQQESPETRDWIDRQNTFTDRVLQPADEFRRAFRERLEQLIDVAEVGSPRAAGDHEIFTLRRAGELKPRIVRRPAPDDDEPSDGATGTGKPDPSLEYEVLVDPLRLRDDGTVSVQILSVSPDASVLLYTVRDGGPDEVEIRALDLETSEELPDRLPVALYGRSIVWSGDSDAFLYVHRSRQIGPRARIHRLGTEVSADAEVLGEGIGPQSFLSVSRILDDSRLLVHINHGWQRHDLYVVPVGPGLLVPSTAPIPLAVDIDAHYDTTVVEGSLHVLTDHQAPRGRWMQVPIDSESPAGWREVIGESDLVLRQVVLAGSGWVEAGFVDATSRVFVLDDAGARVREVELPPLSTALISGGGDAPVRVTVTSFLVPGTEYELDPETSELTLVESPEVEIDASDYEVTQRWARSRDGTRVPYFVVHRQGIALDGGNRALLYGYGGFRSALTPRFSPNAIAWVDAGGVWAHAVLRGGSELGEDWHRGGRLANKQNVFDDFIAVAEDLVAGGFTSPAHLAIRGASNGGLLVGSALTQRPDLFAAVLCGWPDLDMLRFVTWQQTNNQPSLREYGSAAIPEEFTFLRRYSPYQAVRDGVAYPAVMISTGDLDTRVPPLQGRKMAARLQAATTSGRPVILRYLPRQGHAGGLSVQRSIDDIAEELAFAWWQLGPR